MIYQILAKLFLICSDDFILSSWRKPGPITLGSDRFAGSPPMSKTYYVYILASGRYGTPYIGVSRDVKARLEQHRRGRGSQFVHRYGVYRLGPY